MREVLILVRIDREGNFSLSGTEADGTWYPLGQAVHHVLEMAGVVLHELKDGDQLRVTVGRA